MRTPLAALLLLAACTRGDPHEAARDALHVGDHRLAAARFEALISGAEGEQRFLLELDRLRALSHFDAPGAAAGFRRLAADAGHAGRITLQEVSLIVSELVSARAFEEAIGVMDVGLERFPDDPKMRVIADTVVEASRASRNPSVIDLLASHPYAGGGGD